MSLRILAFDTSTRICTVALMIDDIINEHCISTSYQHEKYILSMIDRLLVESGIKLRDLDFLVCCQGPGSFTGVRIGISLVQGLALGSDLPIISVSSLETLAQGMWRLSKSEKILATIDAKFGELYWACYYRQDNGGWLCRSDESIITPNDMVVLIKELHGTWVLVGTGWEDYPVLFASDIKQIVMRKVLSPSAQDMLPIAIRYWNSGHVLSVNEVQPVYLYPVKWKKFHKV